MNFIRIEEIYSYYSCKLCEKQLSLNILDPLLSFAITNEKVNEIIGKGNKIEIGFIRIKIEQII